MAVCVWLVTQRACMARVHGVLRCPIQPPVGGQERALTFTHALRVPGMGLHLRSLCEAVGDVGPGQVGVKLAWLPFLTHLRGNGLL